MGMPRLFPQAAHSGSRSLVLNCSRIGYLHCLGASAPARSCHASRRPAGLLWLAALGPATQSPNPDASARSDEQQLDVPLSQQLSRRRRAKAAPAPPADSDAAEGGPLPAPIPSTPRRGRPPKAASALTDNSSSTSQITTSTSSSLPLPDERATSSSGSSSSDSSTTGASWQLGRSRDVAAGTAAGDGAAPAPGPPQHPAVTFRNAAELRQLLQARAAAAADDGGAPRGEEGQEAAGATQAAQPNTDSGGGAGPPPGAAGTSHRPAAPGPTALPPRRFFAAVPPGRSRDSGTSQFADASGSCRGSSSSSSSSGGGRAGSSTPPPTAQARSSRVTHLPWKGAASRGSGDADSTDGAAGAAADDGSWDHDKDYNKAKTYALRLLQRTPLAAGDLGRRLQERGHGRQAVAALLTWLADNGALNDVLFARLYARSKWVGNLTAPAKIKKDLAAQGVAAAHVAAALTFVFGPSHRVRLSGHSLSAEEQEVQDMYLEAARKQVERRGGGGGAGAGASGGDADDDDDEGLAGGGSDSEREAAAAAFKERDRRRRRLGMWLQYRGHDMDLIIKTFGVLRI